METVLAAEGTNNNGCFLVLVMRSVCYYTYSILVLVMRSVCYYI